MGVNPETPQKEAGHAILPPVDSAIATWGFFVILVNPAAPPDDPPVTLFLSIGFLGILLPIPTFTLKLPKPNSSWLVFPMITAPSFIRCLTAVALNNGL